MSTDAEENSSSPSPFALFADPEFFALASVQFARGMAFATIIIALALYADLFDASGIVAGLFGTAYALVRLVFVLPLGRFVDRGDSKRYLLAGLVLYGVVLVGFTRVNLVEHVVLLRGLQGLSSAMLVIVGGAIVGEISPDGERGLWIGSYNQVRAFSSLAGDLVGGALLFTYGFTTTYTVLIVVTAASTLAVFAFVRSNPGGQTDDEESTGMETLRLLLRRSAIRALVMFRFAFSFGKMAVVLFLPIFARTEFGMSAFAIGGILAGGKLTKSVAQGYVGDLSDRMGHLSWFIIAGSLLYALGTAAIPFASYGGLSAEALALSGFGQRIALPWAFFVLFGAYAALGLADSLRVPTSMTLFVNEGEYYDAVAGSLSLRSVSWQVGAIIGPLAAGIMLDYVSFAAAFWLAAGFIVISTIFFVTLFQTEAPPDVAIDPGD